MFIDTLHVTVSGRLTSSPLKQLKTSTSNLTLIFKTIYKLADFIPLTVYVPFTSLLERIPELNSTKAVVFQSISN